MRRLFGGRNVWVRVSQSFRIVQSRRPFCTDNKSTNLNSNGGKVNSSLSQYDAYRDLDKLDFMTAAKILFTTPPKTKKFGIDFHLVQLFFVCMPSLAVYLVAQYARYEMRRMEAELEQKKKAEEEAKAKEMELKADEEKESESDPELQQVKTRLGKLEEAVKEIVVESKKQSSSTTAKKEEDGNVKTQSIAMASETSNSAAEEQTSNGGTMGSGSNSAAEEQTSNGGTMGSGQQEKVKPAQAADSSQDKVPSER